MKHLNYEQVYAGMYRAFANDFVESTESGARFELVTTDGLKLLLSDATSSDEDGRIVARLTLDGSSKKERVDLTRLDGCEVDFAASAAVDARMAFNCRVFVSGGVGSLQIPGIKNVRRVAP